MAKSEHGDNAPGVRIDRWLWAARFFKTRSLAHQSLKGGKIERNGAHAKPSTTVNQGDSLSITKGETTFEVVVDGLSDTRGPANVAEQLYTETTASVARRREQSAERRAARRTMPRPDARPDKKQRRQLRRFKQSRG